MHYSGYMYRIPSRTICLLQMGGVRSGSQNRKPPRKLADAKIYQPMQVCDPKPEKKTLPNPPLIGAGWGQVTPFNVLPSLGHTVPQEQSS